MQLRKENGRTWIDRQIHLSLPIILAASVICMGLIAWGTTLAFRAYAAHVEDVRSAQEEATHTLEQRNKNLRDQVRELTQTVMEVQEQNTALSARLQETTDAVIKLTETVETLNKMTASNVAVALQEAEGDRRGEWIRVRATAYTARCAGCGGVTATGYSIKDASVDHRVIAVDPKVIPLHSIVEVEGMGTFQALDTGGAIKGNRIDILMQDKQQANDFGVRQLNVRVVRKGE